MKTAPETVAEARQMIAGCKLGMLRCMPERDKISTYKQKIEFIIDYTANHLGEQLTVEYPRRVKPIIKEIDASRLKFQRVLKRKKAERGIK